jgi:hypothetical protein
MCCGNNTLPKSFQTRVLPGKVVPDRAAPKPGPAARSAPAASRFTYTGNTALTVVSPITGKRYRFERSGARAEVDPRDRSWMSFVPNLKAV